LLLLLLLLLLLSSIYAHHFFLKSTRVLKGTTEVATEAQQD
jgi:hypothetical protein